MYRVWTPHTEWNKVRVRCARERSRRDNKKSRAKRRDTDQPRPSSTQQGYNASMEASKPTCSSTSTVLLTTVALQTSSRVTTHPKPGNVSMPGHCRPATCSCEVLT
ncbi:hypothetical protein clg_38 [Corynebacterium phage CL31]|nr:hypothetical protein clg_38 [Corynebacterium phage CL31]